MLNPNQTGGMAFEAGNFEATQKRIMKLNDGNWRAFWRALEVPSEHLRWSFGWSSLDEPSDTHRVIHYEWYTMSAGSVRAVSHTVEQMIPVVSYYWKVNESCETLLFYWRISFRWIFSFWLKSISEFSNCECILWLQCGPDQVAAVDYQTLITNFP